MVCFYDGFMTGCVGDNRGEGDNSVCVDDRVCRGDTRMCVVPTCLG